MINLPTDLPSRLQQSLSLALPGATSQRRKAPEMAFGRHRGPVSPGAHRAAVCICLFRNAEDWWFPLTVRSKQLVDHAGQVSLPGGRIESSEGALQAAKREFQEELGVNLDSAMWLGKLSPLYVYGSHHHVEVFVAALNHRPIFAAEPSEVAEILLMPLRELLDPEKEIIATMQRGPSRFDVPAFRCEQHIVWGATAMILAELVEVLQQTIEPT
jgi:8-oxo-dGTP pyrophosphatase MutT (NUDIX family)